MSMVNPTYNIELDHFAMLDQSTDLVHCTNIRKMGRCPRACCLLVKGNIAHKNWPIQHTSNSMDVLFQPTPVSQLYVAALKLGPGLMRTRLPG